MGNLYSKNHHQGECRWYSMGPIRSFRRNSHHTSSTTTTNTKQQEEPHPTTSSSLQRFQNSWTTTTTNSPSLTNHSFPSSSNHSHTSHSLQSLSHSNTLMPSYHAHTQSADSSIASTNITPFISSSIIPSANTITTRNIPPESSSLTPTLKPPSPTVAPPSQYYSRFTISSTNTSNNTEVIESPPVVVNNSATDGTRFVDTLTNNHGSFRNKRCNLSRQSFSLPKCRSWFKEKTKSLRSLHLLRRRSTTEDTRSTIITGIPLISNDDNNQHKQEQQQKNGIELQETHVVNSNTNTDVSTGVGHVTTGTDTREVNRSNESIERTKRVYSISNLSAASADSWSSSGNVLQRAEESETTMSFDQKDDRRKLASILQSRITRSKSEFSKPRISQEVNAFGDDSSPQRAPVARSSSAPSIINNELDALLRDAIGYQLFKDFCESEYSVENLKFWNELQDMEKNFIDMSGKRRSKVINMVYDKFLDENSTEEVNVRGKTKKLVDQERKSGNIDLERGSQLIHELKRDLYINMIDSFSRFHRTEEYRLWKELKENPENTFEF
ncbi:hypothetical protein C9374_008508 [Naegleria lovaniensis]|uniref:RGS domain-containing protein n=1 Tax=Naegleria lovaniensis TaxID=51637 RepID=A0AA88GKC3_NAELO|nr:uncharacterized protein C9374_008508 [Naegleria lovaniensis]KAG2378365.1 hypothetical protein C9374_008508 [Naegleria lovaniensis]